MSEAPAQKREAPSVLPDRVVPSGAHGRLLIAATELFAARGYHGVSVRDLATHMGVKPSSVYAHYSSKEQLFSKVVSLANEELSTTLRDALLRADPSPSRTLADLVRAYVTFHAEYPLLAIVGHNDLHVLSGASLHRVSQLRRQAVELILSVIERGNADGDFSCAKPHLAVAAVAGIGIRVAAWYRSPDWPWDQVVDNYAEVMAEWMPTYTVEELADEYASYVLALVNSRS